MTIPSRADISHAAIVLIFRAGKDSGYTAPAALLYLLYDGFELFLLALKVCLFLLEFCNPFLELVQNFTYSVKCLNVSACKLGHVASECFFVAVFGGEKITQCLFKFGNSCKRIIAVYYSKRCFYRLSNTRKK